MMHTKHTIYSSSCYGHSSSANINAARSHMSYEGVVTKTYEGVATRTHEGVAART